MNVEAYLIFSSSMGHCPINVQFLCIEPPVAMCNLSILDVEENNAEILVIKLLLCVKRLKHDLLR